MQLDTRKRRILQAIIDEYIDTAEPVGSRSIAKKHELNLSSATIRNEMADLEDMGYLAQPHTSAGRVPSDKGYRLYVDSLMATRDLTIDEVRTVMSEFDLKINELGAIIKSASSVISKLTKYTAVTVAPRQEDSEISAIEALPVGSGKVCVIVVSKSGMVKNSIVSLPPYSSPGDHSIIASLCKRRLCGMMCDQASRGVQEAIREEAAARNVREPVSDLLINAVFDCVRSLGNTEVFVDGTTNIMNFPEFKNIERARELLELLEEKKSIGSVLSDLVRDDRLKVLIGNENTIEEIKDCSIIGATYNAGNMIIGTIGIIGPKRMEYAKVVSMIEYINGVITREITKIADRPDER